MPYTVADVLAAFDEADKNDPYNSFFDLEHPYVYTAGSAMTLFADSTRWAVVFEKSGFAPRGGYPEIELYYFGNCLHGLDKERSTKQFTSNVKYLMLIDLSLADSITDHFDLVKRSATSVTIRGCVVSINQNPDEYKKRGIDISDYENPNRLIDYRSLVCYWADTQPDALLATDAELRTCLPPNLPRLMQIDTWHHKTYLPQYGQGMAPSTYETYRMVAEVLVSQDPTRWKPTLIPNNGWRNWPEAGSL
jgi:hypothetical protein